MGVLSIDNFRDCRSMQNVQFDYTGDLPVGTHKLYATPTIPTGHRVVPVEKVLALAASLRDRQGVAIHLREAARLVEELAAPDAGGV